MTTETKNVTVAVKAAQTRREQPWVEKYRPKSLEQVQDQEDVVQMLKRAISSGALPHLLFYGPPGTGKTSTILAASRDLFGPDLAKERVLELNASHERGIDVIRDKVKKFAQTAVSSSTLASRTHAFKIIVLDEADSMTRDAQAALRRMMEEYTEVTRFCIVCNYVSRIIEPIASRCARFRFRPLSHGAMTQRLRDIARTEGNDLPDEPLAALLAVSGGDLRRAITLLQMTCRLADKGAPVSTDQVVQVAGGVPDEVISGLMRACRSKRFDAVQEAVDEVMALGFPATRILQQLQAAVVGDTKLTLTCAQKSAIALRIAEADHCLLEGADESLQLLDVLSYAQTC